MNTFAAGAAGATNSGAAGSLTAVVTGTDGAARAVGLLSGGLRPIFDQYIAGTGSSQCSFGRTVAYRQRPEAGRTLTCRLVPQLMTWRYCPFLCRLLVPLLRQLLKGDHPSELLRNRCKQASWVRLR